MNLARARGVIERHGWHLSPVALRLVRVRPELPTAVQADGPGSSGWPEVLALLEAGLVRPLAPVGASPSASVVIPARNPDPGTLAHLVTELATLLPTAEVIVVDDGSTDPVTVPEPARVLRHHLALGPGAARNLGAAAASGDVLLFVDADVVALPRRLRDALSLLELPGIVALAPRIGGDRSHDPLDLGPHAAAVSSRSRIGHLPACVLAVRRADFEQVGGFDEALRLGEDVDLVHRLRATGTVVYYCAELTATHRRRPLLARLARAAAYGYSAASLAGALPTPGALALAAGVLAPGGPILVPLAAAGALARRGLPSTRALLPALTVRALEEFATLAARHGALLVGWMGKHTRAQAAFLTGIVLGSRGPDGLACDLAYGIGVATGLLLEPVTR